MGSFFHLDEAELMFLTGAHLVVFVFNNNPKKIGGISFSSMGI
jgi:hypothetical protein